MDWDRFQGWRGVINWCLGRLCLRVYLALPFCIARRNWVMEALLPRAGDYIHWDDTVAIMRKQD
jgi:hypothetical protein